MHRQVERQHPTPTFLQRATALLRRTLPANALWQEPTVGLSAVETHEGVLYMVLRNNKGILAVFQILDDEEMEQLDHWPSEISEEA